jgi:hypothetical protein
MSSMRFVWERIHVYYLKYAERVLILADFDVPTLFREACL